MFDKERLLRNINQPEDKLLVAKFLDQAVFSMKKHESTFTDFCDPRKMDLILKIVKELKDLNVYVFGGNDECERRKIGFCPEYREIENYEFPIMAIEIHSNTKFSKDLTHRDFLGSVLGLGIDRGKVGDIFLFENYTLMYVSKEIAGFIETNLTKVGRTTVKLVVKNIEDVELPAKNIVEKNITVSSLRLDSIIGAMFNMSRGKAQGYIEGEKAFVNWVAETSLSKNVKEGDVISLRGFGRGKIVSVNGKTKKDRISITFEKYV